MVGALSESTHPSIDNLAGRATQAVQWRFAGAVVGVASDFTVGVLLARLLSPSDFGLMALAVVVLRLADPVADLGLGGAVVQLATLTDRHVRAAFTCSFLLGTVITGVVAAAAPFAALVMREPMVTSVLQLLSVAFALRSVGVIAGALLRRRLDFKRQFFIDAGSNALAYGVGGVTLAVLDYGVWSLAWAGVFQALLASSARLVMVRHSVRPLLAGRELRDLFRFGIGSTLSGCVNYLALHADNLVVGLWMGTESLGLYARAYALMNLPHTQTAKVLSSVLFPTLARVQDEPARLSHGYLLTTQLTAMVAASAMGTLAIAAPHLVPSVYGTQWIGVVVPLQILCMAGYFRALYHLGGIVAQSVGRVYSELWRQIIYAGMVIGGAMAGSRYGLPGVAAGVGVAILYMFIATAQLALSATATPWRRYCRVQAGPIVTAGVTCAVAFSVRHLLESFQVPSAGIAFAVIAGAAVPWSAGVLWMLGEPICEPLRPLLPRWCVVFVAKVRRATSGVRSRARSSP